MTALPESSVTLTTISAVLSVTFSTTGSTPHSGALVSVAIGSFDAPTLYTAGRIFVMEKAPSPVGNRRKKNWPKIWSFSNVLPSGSTSLNLIVYSFALPVAAITLLSTGPTPPSIKAQNLSAAPTGSASDNSAVTITSLYPSSVSAFQLICGATSFPSTVTFSAQSLG